MNITIRNWVLEQYNIEEISDICRHGLAGGFSGLIYYTETTEFYDRFEPEIWDTVNEMAEMIGQKPMELIASMNGSENINDTTTFKNHLSWFAVEQVCNQIENHSMGSL